MALVPIKAEWTPNSRKFSKGFLPDGREQFALHIGMGAINYHDGAEYQEIDLTPVVSDHPSFDWMIDKAPYRSYWKNNGDRRVFPNRNNISKYLDLPVPAFLGALGSPTQTGSKLVWKSTDIDVEIAFRNTRITFDVILRADPGFTSIAFPISKIGMSDTEVGTLLSGLKVYEQDKVDGIVRPLDWEIKGNHINVSWDLTGMNYPIVIDPTLDIDIAANADDGYRSPTFYTNSNTFLAFGNLSASVYHTALRFLGVTIKGTTITDAYVTGIANNVVDITTTVCRVEIDAEDHDNPGQIATGDSGADFDSRVRTTAKDPWNPIEAFSSTGSPYDSDPFVSVLQELADRPTFGDDAVIIFLNDDGSDSSATRAFSAFNHTTDDPASLHVEYTTGSVAASSGVATVAGISAADKEADGAASGVATVAGIGESDFDGAAAASGAATVNGAGESDSEGVGASSGSAIVSGEGESDSEAVASASGIATVNGVGDSEEAGSVAVASGIATVNGIGISDAEAVFSAAGVATVLGAASTEELFRNVVEFSLSINPLFQTTRAITKNSPSTLSIMTKQTSILSTATKKEFTLEI